MTFNLSLLSVVWQTCSWTDQDSKAQTRYQFISIWCRVHRSHAQCWMDGWQWLGWPKSDAISKLVTCSIMLSISLCFGGKSRLIVDIASKRDYILAVYILISEGQPKHSRPQSLRSFWPVARIESSGWTWFSEYAQSIPLVFSANQIC